MVLKIDGWQRREAHFSEGPRFPGVYVAGLEVLPNGFVEAGFVEVAVFVGDEATFGPVLAVSGEGLARDGRGWSDLRNFHVRKESLDFRGADEFA